MFMAAASAFVPRCFGAEAEGGAKVIRQAKSATALVLLPKNASTTAFCVDPIGLFITSAHAVAGLHADESLTLVLGPGEADQRSFKAAVVRTDPEADLALLKAQAAGGGFASLQIGTDAEVFETMRVAAFGYPAGKVHADKEDYPSVMVSAARITALSKNKGVLRRIELDSALDAGNDGGPVIDNEGKVIGIVQGGVKDTKIDYAAPVSVLHKILDTPLLLVSAPAMSAAQSHEKQRFIIEVAAPGKSSQAMKVELELRVGQGAPRTFEAVEGAGGAYEISAVPSPNDNSRPSVHIDAQFPQGTVSSVVTDRDVTVGSETVRLSAIRRLEPGTRPTDPPKVVLVGRILNGKLGGLEAVPMQFGNETTNMDLTKATHLTVTPIEQPVSEVRYHAVAKAKGTVIAEAQGVLAIEGSVTSGATAAGPGPTDIATSPTVSETRLPPAGEGPFPAPDLQPGQNIVQLPAPVEDVAVGGGGRYLILYLKKLQQIGIFDVSQAKVVQYLGVPSNDIAIACGAKKLFVGFKDLRQIQRWDLTTFKRELSVPAPPGGIRTMAMGAESLTPLIVLAEQSAKRTWLVNASSMKYEPYPSKNWGGDGSAWGPVHAHVSFDGTTAVACGGGWAGIELTALAGGRVVDLAAGSYVNPGGETLVSGNGALIFPEGGGIMRSDLSSTVSGIEGTPFPADDPAFSLAFRNDNKKPLLVVFSNADPRPIITLRDLEELAENSPLRLDQRIHLIPRAHVLITVGQGGDRLVLRKFDLAASLEAEGIDYLFVESAPLRTAERGTTYKYPIIVRSKRGNVKMSLQTAPHSMDIGKDGVLRWIVPTGAQAREDTVIIQISDDSGQQIFHSFKITIMDRVSRLNSGPVHRRD